MLNLIFSGNEKKDEKNRATNEFWMITYVSKPGRVAAPKKTANKI